MVAGGPWLIDCLQTPDLIKVFGSSMSTATLKLPPQINGFPASNGPDYDVRRPGYIGIGEMAKRHATTLRTLRFYEAKGLLKPHRDGQHRFYDGSSERRFKLIDEGRKLGFTLTEIAELIGPSQSVAALNLSLQRITDQITHLEEQHRQVNSALSALRRRYYLMSDNEETTPRLNPCEVF
jgi:DNA-binding transcriptional MerR regulator